MSRRRRLWEVVLVGTVVLVGLLVLRASSRDPTKLNFLDRAVLRLTSPVQSAISSALHSVGRTWHGYVALVDVQHENFRLREENRKLQAQLSESRLSQQRMAELERLLDLRKEVPSETASARVIGVDSSPHFRVVRLRLDRGQGVVKPGMVVLVPEGVVGRVRRVFGPYCDVMLVVDPDSSIDVRVPRSGARGLLKGLPGSELSHIPQMPRGEDARVGDEVVTSGIGGLPREVPVGRIVKVQKPDSGLWQEVVVQPTVDFDRLTDVLVVLAPPPPPDPETGRKVPEPRHGLMAPR